MKKISVLIIVALLQIPVEAQYVKDSLKSRVIYISKEIENRYIIQLTSSPVSLQKIEKKCLNKFGFNNSNYKALRVSLIKEGIGEINAEQDDFIAEFNKLSKRSVNGKDHHQKIIRQYKRVFNGFAVEADSLTIKDILKISHVKKVFKDRIIKLNDNTSNDVIRAPQVWQQTGATGKNIKIGILDTGIDPDHPDLAGRVLRGYDFVNNDTIPFDDHGHGTHCAGISAANGPTLKGVAPDALLVPIKVLDADGYGTWSNIIAGVNYAIDPDSNALTDDGVKILSISLGGPGYPDDPLAQSIDNAFANNVLCVVAAGNNGNIYYSIGSPGCAQNALTVGATDNYDNLAYFSSFGPVRGTFQVKPEVLAPGVDIYSTLPNGQYASWSGTSMATPHVSGAAALLMELYPDWTPAQVKSAIISSAKDLGMEIWKQGNGRIDVFNAAKIKTTTSPGIVSFGNVNDTSGVWNASKTIKIYNYQKKSVNYSLSIDTSALKGISFSFPQHVVTSDSASFIFSVNVNVDSANFPDTIPSYLSGKLILTSDFDTTVIPYSINRCRSFQITFDKIPDFVFLPDMNGELVQPDDTILNYDIEYERDADIITYFDYHYTIVVKENVHLTNNLKLRIESSEANYKMKFQAVDENDQPLKISDGHEVLFCPKNDMLLITVRFGINSYSDSIIRRITKVSDKYIFNYMPTSFSSMNPNKRYYEFPIKISNGISGDLSVINSSGDFRKVIRKFPSLLMNKNIYAYRHRLDGSRYFNFGELNCIDRDYSIGPDNTSIQYMIPYPKDSFFLNYQSLLSFNQMIGSYPDFTNDIPLLETGNEVLVDGNNLEIGTGESLAYVVRDVSVPIKDNVFNITYGMLPTHYAPNYVIKQRVLSLNPPFHTFMFSCNDIIPGNIDCKLYKADVPDTSFTVFNNSYYECSDYNVIKIKLDSGEYTFEQVYKNGLIEGLSSISTARYTFNSDRYLLPKRINKIVFKSNNSITDHLIKGANNTIEIASQCEKDLHVYVKLLDDTVWQNIPLVKTDSVAYFNYYNYAVGQDTNFLYKGQIPDSLKLGYYSLRLIIPSYSGDTMNYSVEPAFIFYKDSCDKSDSLTFPKVIINSSDPDNKACTGDSVTLSAIGADLFKWSTLQNISKIAVDTSGTYTVVGKNLNGCSDTASVSVIFNPVYNITRNIEICEGESYNGHTASGTYVENLNSVNGCDSIITTKIKVNQLPEPELGNDTFIYTNQILQLDPGVFASYLWSDGSTTESVFFNGSIGAGSYTRWVRVTDSKQCTGYDTIKITVTGNVNLEFLTNGVILKLFPNPVNKLLNILLLNAPNDIEYAEIYNSKGQLVSRFKFAAGSDLTKTAQFDVTGIPSGLYFLKIQNKTLNIEQSFMIY